MVLDARACHVSSLTPMLPSQIASEHIRAELGRQRLTGADLARRVNRSEMWVSRRLNDLTPCTIDDLARIAAALNVPLESLIDLKASV